MDNKELTAFLRAYASDRITLPDGILVTEVAVEPTDGAVQEREDA